MKKFWIMVSTAFFLNMALLGATIEDALSLSEENPIKSLEILDNIKYQSKEDEIKAYNSIMLIFAMNDMDKYLNYLETRKEDSKYLIWGFMNAGVIKYAENKKKACEWTVKLNNGDAQQATKSVTCLNWLKENQEEYKKWAQSLSEPKEKALALSYLENEIGPPPNPSVIEKISIMAKRKNHPIYLDAFIFIESEEDYKTYKNKKFKNVYFPSKISGDTVLTTYCNLLESLDNKWIGGGLMQHLRTNESPIQSPLVFYDKTINEINDELNEKCSLNILIELVETEKANKIKKEIDSTLEKLCQQEIKNVVDYECTSYADGKLIPKLFFKSEHSNTIKALLNLEIYGRYLELKKTHDEKLVDSLLRAEKYISKYYAFLGETKLAENYIIYSYRLLTPSRYKEYQKLRDDLLQDLLAIYERENIYNPALINLLSSKKDEFKASDFTDLNNLDQIPLQLF